MPKETTPTEVESLKIIGLAVDGLRKLKAVELKFNETGLTQILGDNEEGKTTLGIDALQILIRGNKYSNKDIVGKGKSKATLVGQLGPYKITRILPREGTPTLKAVDTRTGQALTGRVQDFLETLINELTFNPRPFLFLSKNEKLKFMMDLCKIDFSEMDAQIDSHYNKRKAIGQEIDRYGEIIVPKALSRINTTEIIEQKKKITEQNSGLYLAHEEAKTKQLNEIDLFNKAQREIASKATSITNAIGNFEAGIESNNEEIAKLEERIESLKKSSKLYESEIAEKRKQFNKLPKPQPEKPLAVDIPEPNYLSVDDLDKKLEYAAEINQEANEYDNQIAKAKEKESKETEKRKETEIIDGLRKQKLEILAGTKTGVEGLQITEDDILYNGISSDNWSDAQGLIISSELCIAQMPKLRAVFMDRAESIGKKKLAEYEKWALANGIQVVITKVVDEAPKSKDEFTYFIVDGSVVEEDEE
jgi:uncharacterized protein YlxW (UPF0749 family)